MAQQNNSNNPNGRAGKNNDDRQNKQTNQDQDQDNKRGLGSDNIDPKKAEEIHKMGGEASHGGGRNGGNNS